MANKDSAAVLDETDDDVFEADRFEEADKIAGELAAQEAEASKEGLALIPEVPSYYRHWNEDEPKDKPEHFAAIFFKGGKEPSTRDVQEEFDFWAYVTDPKIILRADDSRMAMGESDEDLQRRLDAKYPAPPGCSRLLFGKHELHVPWEPSEQKRYRERNRPYKKKTMRGWVVLKYPLVVDYIDLDQVRQLSMEHGPLLLLEKNAQIDDLMEAGFSPVGGGHDLIKVRWNPQAVALRKWRKEVKDVEATLVNEFNEAAVAAFTKCFNPAYWPAKFPFQDTLGHDDDYNPGVAYYRKWIALAQKLKPGSKPWRKVSCHTGTSYNPSRLDYVAAVQALLPFVRTVQKRAECHIQKKLVRFIIAEAKALKFAIPPMPKVPAKPFTRKLKKKAAVVPHAEAMQYLQHIFGYQRIEEIDPFTAADLLDNAKDGHPLDQQIWDAYATYHHLKPWNQMSPLEFHQSIVFQKVTRPPKWAERNRHAHQQNTGAGNR